jgi:hypothetical protein
MLTAMENRKRTCGVARQDKHDNATPLGRRSPLRENGHHHGVDEPFRKADTSCNIEVINTVHGDHGQSLPRTGTADNMVNGQLGSNNEAYLSLTLGAQALALP